MPFDVLPHHDIRFPRVEFYHPSPELARLQVEGARFKAQMVMQAMDKVLDAADPVNRAQRQMALRNLQYETQYGMSLKEAQAQYQMKYGIPMEQAQAEAMMQWHRLHPNQPWLSPQEQLALNKLNQQNEEAGTYNDALNPSGGGNQGIYKSGGPGGGVTSQQATNARWERYKQEEESWLQRQPTSEQLWQTPSPALLPESPSVQAQPQIAPTTQDNTAGPDITQPTGEQEEMV